MEYIVFEDNTLKGFKSFTTLEEAKQYSATLHCPHIHKDDVCLAVN